jgi:MOSC domain-containing protein
VVDDAVRLGATVETAIFSRTALGRVVEGPWAPAISSFAGRPVRLVRCERPGGTRSRPGEPHATNTVSLVSDGSLRRLAGALGVEAVDARRFRMLIELQGAEPHEEDDWIGRQVRVGSAVLSITKPDARCAITTQDPDTGARDLDTLRALIGYRGLRDRRKVDFGVLGEVAVPGRLSVGDEVMVETSPPT